MRITKNYRILHGMTFFIMLILVVPLPRSFAGPNSEAVADGTRCIYADKQFEFAEYCFGKKEFSNAAAEFQRFVYFFPKDERVETALFKIGTAYYFNGQYTEAIAAFKSLIEKYGETDLGLQSYWKISESHLKLGGYGAAVINLQNLIALSDDQDVRDEAYYRIGWIHIETASWEEAGRSFAKISSRNMDKYKLRQLVDELEKEKSIPKKSPRFAGLLSIVPGVGFLYCERYQDALIAFLINGGLIWAAYESFDEDLDALGALITFVEIGFYAGNIYGAVNSAHKFNRNQTRRFIERLKENTKLTFSGNLKNQGVCISLRFSF